MREIGGELRGSDTMSARENFEAQGTTLCFDNSIQSKLDSGEYKLALRSPYDRHDVTDLGLATFHTKFTTEKLGPTQITFNTMAKRVKEKAGELWVNKR